MSAQIKAASFDLAHPTYYQRLTPGGLSRLRRPLVITVHDMIHELYSEQMDPQHEMAQIKRDCIEQADAILCNSASTRSDLLNRFPKVESKIFVTPLASSMSIDSSGAAGADALEAPYFFYVGGREGYKNFGVLLTAWHQFIEQHPDFQLKIVGSPWLPEERQRMAELSLEKSIVHLGRADESHLANLYHQSVALVYPSLYEGFGIPLLEAMQCQTAVICANTSSLPEVGGTAPLYFNPTDAEALCAQMKSLVDSPGLRADHVKRGVLREQQFSWERTAELTFAVYKRLIASAQ